jgi:hypothetical protein
VVVDGALGSSRRAGGVVDRDRLVLVLERRRKGVRGALGEELLVRVIRLSGVVDPDYPRDARVVGELLELSVDKGEARGRVLEVVLDLLTVEPIVDGHQHATGRRHAVVGLEQRGNVRRDEGDAVTLLQPGAAQGGGKPAHPLTHLALCVAPFLMNDGDLVRVDELAALQEAQRIQFASMGTPHVRSITDSLTPPSPLSFSWLFPLTTRTHHGSLRCAARGLG